MPDTTYFRQSVNEAFQKRGKKTKNYDVVVLVSCKHVCRNHRQLSYQ